MRRTVRSRQPTVCIVTLGCSKNEVDSQTMLGLLARRGWKPRRAVRGADLAILNTCAFIGPASEESAAALAELADLKRRGEVGRLIVTGCLPQKHGSEDLLGAAAEVDAFVGTGDIERIAAAAGAALSGRRGLYLRRPGARRTSHLPRITLGPAYSRYVKVSEGCSNCCAYCVIPRLRGAHRSRPMRSILREVRTLAPDRPLAELNIIGQDTTSYGTDLYGRSRLPELIRAIARLDAARWIRILYAHPAHVTRELVATIAETPSVCPYLDLPLQHIADRILRRMGRKTTRRKVERLIADLRERVPGIAIRTAFIVGLPGETDADFEELLAFVRETRFDRLGAFAYSPEEGTRAARLDGQVPERIKQRRLRRLLSAQKTVSARLNRRLIGKRVEVLVEETHGTGEEAYAAGRTARHAPDVDGGVIITGCRTRPGRLVTARVTDALDYDLIAAPET